MMTIRTIVDAGSVCGTLVNLSDVERYLDKNVRLVYDHTNHMLSHGVRTFLERVEKAA